MSSFFQHTIARRTRVSGTGVHTGRDAAVQLIPAAPDAGVAFRRTDLGRKQGLIQARAEAVCETRLGTVIGEAGGARVSTIEHLMAALAAVGVDNLLVEIDGPEVPIMDGSAMAFLEALDGAGLRRQDAPRRHVEILEPIEVGGAGRRASLSPADRFEMAAEICFDAPAIGRQRLDLVVDEHGFRTELAQARTFGFLGEVEALRAAGHGRGATLENTIVVDGDRILNPGLMRRSDDFVRHKLLDALGDLALVGAPIIGRYQALRPGHGLNNELARALADRPEAWRFVTRSPELAQAV
ncbi:MAG TPA: UDP-3-O-acyl-N-acetylglucosamine deacetylase [Caulobacteraceae bacterium]|nr:UDP-3-O-acyl-N-acetylglucosamine deacetylase [Caulobacteraceae bacterium]